MNKTKWILFDFGGCLDSDGIHSRTLFLNFFMEFGLIKDKQNISLFQDAYSYSDRMVINHSLIVDSTLLKMNEVMCSLIAKQLNVFSQPEVSIVALAITDFQANHLRRNKKILEKLKDQYQLGIISNFSGNLTKILEEFNISKDFTFVLDSYHVGFCKPSHEIFKLAVEKCKSAPNEICFVGDNILRDIAPAKEIGMKTILISQVHDICVADYTLTSLEGLLSLTQRI